MLLSKTTASMWCFATTYWNTWKMLQQCMRELYRIMRPGGWGIFRVPIDVTRTETYEDKSITFARGPRDPLLAERSCARLFGLDYKQKLEAAGFKVTEDDYAQTLTGGADRPVPALA